MRRRKQFSIRLLKPSRSMLIVIFIVGLVVLNDLVFPVIAKRELSARFPGTRCHAPVTGLDVSGPGAFELDRWWQGSNVFSSVALLLVPKYDFMFSSGRGSDWHYTFGVLTWPGLIRVDRTQPVYLGPGPSYGDCIN